MPAAAPSLKDAYAALGLKPGADAASARAAFRANAKASHPDRAGGDAARFRETVEAWDQVRAALAAASPAANRRPILSLTPMQALRGGEVELDGTRMAVHPGLRTGDRVRLADDGLEADVIVRSADGLSVLGDDLIMEAAVPTEVLAAGGRITVETWAGPRGAWITAGQTEAVLPGLGLAAWGGRAEGRLIVRLWAAETAPSAGRGRLDRFARDWTSGRRAA